jgi:Uma2 family endonuclease
VISGLEVRAVVATARAKEWTKQPWRFTVEEYHRMIADGILDENDRVELIEGELVQMAAVGSYHAASVDALNEWFVRGLRSRAVVRVQNPLRLSSASEPEPDLALPRPRADRYFSATPAAEDALLVVEVADTTLRYDRTVKLPLYAAAGIPEAWVIDVVGSRAFVYRDPDGGEYREMTTVARGGTLTPLAFPDLALPLAAVLPPPEREA